MGKLAGPQDKAKEAANAEAEAIEMERKARAQARRTENRAGWLAWHQHRYLVHARAAAYHARKYEALQREEEE